ncbi:MFS transporter [Nonomuraea sp. LPB2021202275-12-8]|uniref:MFS transporter n=1 Tax=Nonomuraea sp. LPB2021202275-12-8 TaxID=3120159 RepID=UPI00300C9AB5
MSATRTVPSSTAPPRPAGADRPRLWTRGFALAIVAGCGSSISFYLLFSAVPLYAASDGGGVGAGLATGAMMLTTVAAELATPRLLARYGYRLVFAASLVLLGVPALALAVWGGMAAVLVACLVRGVGFGIAVVLGGVLVALAVPEERRGEGIGVYGVICGIPSLIALPLGVWVADAAGFPLVFAAGGVAALAGLAAVRGLPGRPPDPEPSMGVAAALRGGTLVRPSIVFAATTVAAGVVATFLPLAVAGAAWALLAQSATTTVTRWWAGRHGDRHGHARLLMPGLLVSAAGMIALALASGPAAVVAAMVLFGAGFGIVQNASMAVMLTGVPSSSYGAVTALWSVAYDAGLGAGALAFGAVAVHTGYPAGFGLTGLLMLISLVTRFGKVRK